MPPSAGFSVLHDVQYEEEAADPGGAAGGGLHAVASFIDNRAREVGFAVFEPHALRLRLCQYVESGGKRFKPGLTGPRGGRGAWAVRQGEGGGDVRGEGTQQCGFPRGCCCTATAAGMGRPHPTQLWTSLSTGLVFNGLCADLKTAADSWLTQPHAEH